MSRALPSTYLGGSLKSQPSTFTYLPQGTMSMHPDGYPQCHSPQMLIGQNNNSTVSPGAINLRAVYQALTDNNNSNHTMLRQLFALHSIDAMITCAAYLRAQGLLFVPPNWRYIDWFMRGDQRWIRRTLVANYSNILEKPIKIDALLQAPDDQVLRLKRMTYYLLVTLTRRLSPNILSDGIHALPPEIITLIIEFAHYDRPYELVFMSLSAVSRLFRDVITRRTTFWTHINLRENVNWTRLKLMRSRESDIDVTFSLRWRVRRGALAPLESHVDLTIIQEVANESKRWKCFQSIADPEECGAAWASICQILSGLDLPRLQELHANRLDGTIYENWRMPNLERITCDQTVRAKPLEITEKLRSFKFKYILREDHLEQETTDMLFKALRAPGIKRLHTLELLLSYDGHEDTIEKSIVSGPPVVLGEVERFNLKYDSLDIDWILKIITQIHLPRVQAVSLNEGLFWGSFEEQWNATHSQLIDRVCQWSLLRRVDIRFYDCDASDLEEEESVAQASIEEQLINSWIRQQGSRDPPDVNVDYYS